MPSTKGRPVAYASRSLNPAECNYAQIEKELLAIVFACHKFHHYIYGFPIDVQSDHKPLEQIINKPLCQVSPRLQRMLLKLQRYNINIKYTRGKDIYAHCGGLTLMLLKIATLKKWNLQSTLSMPTYLFLKPEGPSLFLLLSLTTHCSKSRN